MISLTVCVLLLVMNVATTEIQQYPEEKDDAYVLFQSWLAENGRQYKTSSEASNRFRNFLNNLKLINHLNTLHRGEVVFAVNQFADVSPAEFRSTILMAPRAPPKHLPERYAKVSPVSDIPESFDWTDKRMVTAVKDQGSVGTCWAFSTIGNLEGQWAMQGKQLTNFSVEQVVDCDSTKDPAHDRADCGVFGGWPYLAYQYIKQAVLVNMTPQRSAILEGGIESWDDYGYCSGIGGGPGSCFPCPADGYNKTLCGPPVQYCLKNESCSAKLNPDKFVPGLKVIDWKAFSENETEIAMALMDVGPLSVALDASGLQFYHHGVFAPVLGCSKTELDHAVLLVGFGVEKSFLGEKPYWKVKNSWGARWGLNGYFYIKRGSGECGINTQVTSALLEK